MKSKFPMTAILLVVLLICHAFAHAQQYGWVRVARLNGPLGLNAVEFVDSLHGWTGESSGTMYRTTDGGNAWVPCVVNAPLVISSISMKDTMVGWTVGIQGSYTGKITKTVDGGRTWNQQWSVDSRVYENTSALTRLVNLTSGSTSALDTGKLIETRNGGTIWTERTFADSIRRIGKFHFIDSLHGWVSASGQRGRYLLKTIDGGTGWQVFSSPGVYLVSFLDTLHGWGTSGSFEIYRTRDGGMTWQFLYNGFPEDVGVYAISFLDSLNGRIFGGTFYHGRSADVIMRTTNGGTSWYQESIGLSSGSFGDIEDAVMLDATHGWAVCGDRSVLRYQVTTSVAERLPELPKGFSLRQNYPNPFNPTTTIEYEIAAREQVRLVVYDELGKELRTLVNDVQDPGVYRVQFAVDALALIASGHYYYTLTAGNYKQTRSMILLK